jgi:hypothetical protein
MAVARPGGSSLDRDVVEKFAEALQLVGVSVGQLADTNVIQLIGVDAREDVEKSLRQIRHDVDRGLIAFAKYRTSRARQDIGAVIDTLNKGVADLDELSARLEAESKGDRLGLESEPCPIYQIGVEDEK